MASLSRALRRARSCDVCRGRRTWMVRSMSKPCERCLGSGDYLPSWALARIRELEAQLASYQLARIDSVHPPFTVHQMSSTTRGGATWPSE
jgi:hypothetical protein